VFNFHPNRFFGFVIVLVKKNQMIGGVSRISIKKFQADFAFQLPNKNTKFAA